jgi:hypothetical protein
MLGRRRGGEREQRWQDNGAEQDRDVSRNVAIQEQLAQNALHGDEASIDAARIQLIRVL